MLEDFSLVWTSEDICVRRSCGGWACDRAPPIPRGSRHSQRLAGRFHTHQRAELIDRSHHDFSVSAKGIVGEVQDTLVTSITSFARYGFPESHAISFALLAYASTYLKCHHLAAFTCALLNNQPMGFYHPAVLIKDAQRHGLRVLPINVNRSDWDCTIRILAGRAAEAEWARWTPWLMRNLPSLSDEQGERLAQATGNSLLPGEQHL